MVRKIESKLPSNQTPTEIIVTVYKGAQILSTLSINVLIFERRKVVMNVLNFKVLIRRWGKEKVEVNIVNVFKYPPFDLTFPNKKLSIHYMNNLCTLNTTTPRTKLTSLAKNSSAKKDRRRS